MSYDESFPVASHESGLPPDIRALIDLRMPRQQMFVERYCLHGNAHRAVLDAGYAQRSARQRAAKFLAHPTIGAAIGRVRAALAERHNFTSDKAMEQLSEDRKFAIKTENATAAVRASELMARMAGHLVDRLDARLQQVPFRIEIAGIDGGGQS